MNAVSLELHVATALIDQNLVFVPQAKSMLEVKSNGSSRITKFVFAGSGKASLGNEQ